MNEPGGGCGVPDSPLSSCTEIQVYGPVEQRRQPRIPFSCSARLVADGRNVPIAAQVQNLSAGGLFLTADVAPALGTAVRCRFRIGHTPRELRGRIAWVERRPSGDPRGPGAGIEFLDLRESERLLLEDVTSGAPKEDESPLQALSVWFEGLTAPVRTQGHVSADEIVVTTQLPFLRIGSDVKVGFSPEEDGPHRYARIDGLSLDFLRPHEPPRIVVTLRTANELQGEAGELSHALRSRREAFAGSESAPHPPEAPRPVPRGAEPPSAPRAAEPPSAPRAAEPPSAPRAAEPPSAPRAAEPPSAPRAAEPPSAPRAGARRVFTSAGALTPPPQLLGSMAPELQRPGATPALLGASPLATLAAAPVPRTPVPAPAAPVPLGPIAAARSGPSAAPGPVRAGALPWRKTFMLAAVALCVGASAVFLFRGSRHEPSRVAAPSPAAPARPQVSPLGPVPLRSAPANRRPGVRAKVAAQGAGAAPSPKVAVVAAPAESPKPVDDLPPLPRFAKAPFRFERTAGATTVVVPIWGPSAPVEVLRLAPQPGVVAILSKAKLPRGSGNYVVRHPIIDRVVVEERPLGLYARVLFGPRAGAYEVKGRVGELRISVQDK